MTPPLAHRAFKAIGVRALGLVIICAVSLLGPCLAQAQQYTFRQYDQQDGLTNLSVTCMLQDHIGFVWTCSGNGLFRYDGTRFERFSEANGLTDTEINGLMEDPLGRLWAGTPRDLYVGDARGFKPVRPDGRSISIEKGLLFAALSAHELLVVDHGHLLRLSTQDQSIWHSAPYFNAAQLAQFPLLNRLGNVVVDRTGTIWLGCGSSICAVRQGRISQFGVAAGIAKDVWLSWLLDRNGRLWARGLSHIAVLEPGARTFHRLDAPHEVLTADIMFVPLIEDAQGHVITRSDAGLLRWESDHWQELTVRNGLPAYGLYAMVAARDGSMWLGTSGHGAYRWLGYGQFESWTTQQGLGANSIWAVMRDHRGSLYLSTRSGCEVLDEAAHHAKPCSFRGMPSGEIQVMAERHDGSLWFGMTTGRLLRIDPARTHAQVIGNVPLMRKLYVDAADRIWISSNEGMRVIPTGSDHPQLVALPGDFGELTDIAQDDQGHLWVASQRGLLLLDGERWNVMNINDEHAKDGFVSVLVADHGWIWAGSSSHGLMHLHAVDGRIDEFHWIDDAAVAQTEVYFLNQDAQHNIWVGSDSGLAVYDGHVWRRFTQADGLIWNDTNEDSDFIDADGSLWAGTSGGLTHILHPTQLLRSAPMQLLVTHASLGIAPLGAPRVRIPWTRNLPLDVQMADLDYDVAQDAVVNVRLLGLSDEWFQTRNHTLHYPGLAPGRYTLEAYASDPDQARSSPETRISFRILPPWWQSAWFRVLCALAIAAVLAAVWRWRTWHLEHRRRELERALYEREVLLERATHDALTKLWNRQAILDILERQIQATSAAGTGLGLAVIDMDHFKRVNDTYGHLGGDAVLRALGEQLPAKLLPVEALGRYGGEEFLLVMPGSEEQVPSLPMERLRRAISELAITYEGAAIPVTASIGVAWLRPGESADALIGRADAALYSAKDLGRNRVEYAASTIPDSMVKHSA